MNSEPGYCPICREEIGEYSAIKIDPPSIGYPFVCPNGHTGIEWYMLEYDVTEMDEYD